MSQINNDLKMRILYEEPQDMMSFDGAPMDARTGEANAPSEGANDAKTIPNQTTEFVPLSRFYLEDWACMEHILKIGINPDSKENGPSSSQSVPRPQEIGLDNNSSAEESPEENIHDLIMAFDNVILSQPNQPCARLEDLQYIDFEIYPYTACTRTVPGDQVQYPVIYEKMQE